MTLASLPPAELERRLRAEGLTLAIGPFTLRVRSPLRAVARDLATLYADAELRSPADFADFHVRVAPPPGLRRWLRPQVQFYFDGTMPFEPLPLDHAYAFLEWGLNWCIHAHLHHVLVLHAGVVERGGFAAVMPGIPGAGKSTLCAALALRGWRLLSDELALVSPQTGLLTPVPRPVSLKDQSIDVIARFSPGAVFGTRVPQTEKGAVAHLRPPAESVARRDEPARPGWLVFPRYEAGSDTLLEPLPAGQAFIRAADDAFNYSLLGEQGFRTMGDLVAASDCYTLTYSRLEEAVEAFAALAPPQRP